MVQTSSSVHFNPAIPTKPALSPSCLSRQILPGSEVSLLLKEIAILPVGILGLTVLAIGNSVGDWVADTAVARAGKPGMGIASCFGSPLLNDVLGLSIALIVSQVT